MSIPACRKTSVWLTLLALWGAGCERPTPTSPDTGEAASNDNEAARRAYSFAGEALQLRTTDERQEILRERKAELWPCPPGYEPIQMHEFVPSTPPLKPPGHPEYWEGCPATPGHFTNHNSSVGTAAHLGEFTNEWDSCLDVINAIGFFDAQLTAANGDQLNWAITAQATPLPGGDLFFETTNITFDGGTGRFTNASGYASGAGSTVGEGENYYYVGCLSY